MAIARDNAGRNSHIQQKIKARLGKKLRELKKKYPSNEYKIVETKHEDNRSKKTHTFIGIVRTPTVGRRHHYTKDQTKLRRSERARTQKPKVVKDITNIKELANV